MAKERTIAVMTRLKPDEVQRLDEAREVVGATRGAMVRAMTMQGIAATERVRRELMPTA